VSFADLMPIRIGILDRPRKQRHRAIDEVDRQRALRYGADLLIKSLQLQLTDQEAEHAEIIARIDERHAEIVEGLEQQIADLKRRLAVGVLAESAATKTQELSIAEIRQHCVTPVPLHQAPFATTNPGRTPAWARCDDEVA
jgi:predicted  nucleic acid-binding Zn-ribbon protein